MDSIGKIPGSGDRKWYVKNVAEEMGKGFKFHFEKEIGAGFSKLADVISSNPGIVDDADAVW
eukprot:10784367-Prorocentrum_lima.AAC.1